MIRRAETNPPERGTVDLTKRGGFGVHEREAVELAQRHLESLGQSRCNVKFARLIPANSSDPFDGCYPNDIWAVFFEMGIPDLDPDFFVLHVNCQTKSVAVVPVM